MKFEEQALALFSANPVKEQQKVLDVLKKAVPSRRRGRPNLIEQHMDRMPFYIERRWTLEMIAKDLGICSHSALKLRKQYKESLKEQA